MGQRERLEAGFFFVETETGEGVTLENTSSMYGYDFVQIFDCNVKKCRFL